MNGRKIFYRALVLLSLLPGAMAYAAYQPIHASISLRQAIALSPINGMNFGGIFFSGAPTAADSVTLATNGTQTYAGGVFSGPSSGTPGDVRITAGTNGRMVQVYCSSAATMTRIGGGSIQVTNIVITPENATGPAGTGHTCLGMGTAAFTFSLARPTFDDLKLGGRINGATASSFAGGVYRTSNPGGTSIRVDVVYQ